MPLISCPYCDMDIADPAHCREQEFREFEAELMDMTAQAKTLALARDGFAARAEKAEARVAELERMEEFWHNLAWLHVPHDIIERKLKDPGSLLPPDMAREREE